MEEASGRGRRRRRGQSSVKDPRWRRRGREPARKKALEAGEEEEEIDPEPPEGT